MTHRAPVVLSLALCGLIGATSCPTKENDPGPTTTGTGGSTAGSGTGAGGSAAGSGSAGGSAGVPGTGGTGGTLAPSQPLAPTAFLFERILKEGTGSASQIYSYDTATSSETLVTVLDAPANAPATGPDLRDLALSPDRTQIAFSTPDFRPDPVQTAELFRLDAVWITDLQGRQFQRLSSEYQPTFNRGRECTINTTPCPLPGETCRSGYCTRPDLYVWDRHLTWAPNGRIYFENFHLWFVGSESAFQVAYLMSATPEAPTRALDLPYSCRSLSPASFLPSTSELLVFRNACGNGVQEGVVSYSAEPFAERSLLLPQKADLDVNVSRSAITPDEQFMYFTAGGPMRKSIGLSKRTRLVRWNIKSGDLQTLYEPTADADDLVDLAITPSGAIIVEVATTAANSSQTSRLARFQAATSTLEFLSIQGNVRKPR